MTIFRTKWPFKIIKIPNYEHLAAARSPLGEYMMIAHTVYPRDTPGCLPLLAAPGARKKFSTPVLVISLELAFNASIKMQKQSIPVSTNSNDPNF